MSRVSPGSGQVVSAGLQTCNLQLEAERNPCPPDRAAPAWHPAASRRHVLAVPTGFRRRLLKFNYGHMHTHCNRDESAQLPLSAFLTKWLISTPSPAPPLHDDGHHLVADFNPPMLDCIWWTSTHSYTVTQTQNNKLMPRFMVRIRGATVSHSNTHSSLSIIPRSYTLWSFNCASDDSLWETDRTQLG